MAAPNAQPCGSRPGPKAPNTHAPHDDGMPSSSGKHGGGQVAPHGTPSPVGNGKKNPLK